MKTLSRLTSVSRVFAMLAVCVLLAACGSKVKGVYADSTGALSADFDGSNVKMTMAGATMPPMAYTVEGKTIKVSGGDAMTINDDGSLTGPGGLKLVKK